MYKFYDVISTDILAMFGCYIIYIVIHCVCVYWNNILQSIINTLYKIKIMILILER